MKTVTIPFTVNIPETARPFGDELIYRRMREGVRRPPASKFLGVKILGKARDASTMDYVISGEVTFGRWFPFPRKGRSK